MTTSPVFASSPLASLLRQVGPILLLAAGVVGGVAWAVFTGDPLTSSPPFLLAQGALVVTGLLVVSRGVPRWSYPWLAFGIGGAHYLLRFLILPDPLPEDETPSAVILAIGLLAGPVLAMLLAALIAGRRWSDAAAFIGFYLVSTGIGLPSLRQPEAGPVVSLEIARVALLSVQVALAGAAIVAWNNRAIGATAVLLLALLAFTPLALGFLLPRSQTQLPEDFSAPWLLIDFARLYLVIALFTFAAGAVRRVLGGQGILSGRVAPQSSPSAT